MYIWKNVVYGPRDDPTLGVYLPYEIERLAIAENCECFSRPSLAVGHDCTVVPLQYFLDYFLRAVVVGFLLVKRRGQHSVVDKLTLIMVRLEQENAFIIFMAFGTYLLLYCLVSNHAYIFLYERSHSNSNSEPGFHYLLLDYI